MLKKFKHVKTVTRDFSKTYKASIEEALPNAKQIVDRFHVLKNLTDDISGYIKRVLGDKLRIVGTPSLPVLEKEIRNEREHKKVETGMKKWELIKEAKKMKQAGKNNSEIARVLHIARSTVIKYLNITEPPIDSRPCILDPFVPRIKELILEGYKYTEIFHKIKEEGYEGQISLYNSKMKGIRWEVKHMVRYLKRSDIKKLLYQPIDKIKDKQKREDVETFLKEHHIVKEILELVAEFKTVLLGNEKTKLRDWIEKTEKYKIPELDSFVKLIRWDLDAVENAITYNYSNGLTEGHNNKIKLIKRQMYGRCNFDLLRLKVLS